MKQSSALQILKTGQNVFLTGQAGSGKTYVLTQYIRYLRLHEIDVAVTASTGIAATHMNGTTIHAWSGMGIKDSFESSDYKRLKSRHNLVERLKDTKVLIIDEVSMLHAKQVDLLDEILRTVRENETAFGGMQVIFSGDFFQLPPVGNKGESNKEKFAFMAKAWLDANFWVCYLQEQHRQTLDVANSSSHLSLTDVLNQIRAQDVSHDAIQALLATKNNTLEMTRTRLYTHNASVDTINDQELSALTTKDYVFECSTYGEAALVETLKKNVRAVEKLVLKVGAKVMFVKNNPTLEVSNGTMGEVVDFLPLPKIGATDTTKDTTKKYPVVKLNSGRTVIAEPEEWVIEDTQGEVLAAYSQIPLCLAWAITIHKSQGMTLDAAEIDLSHTFEMGQGYVALSRVRSLEGLRLLGLNNNSLRLDEWVFRVDKRLLELAAQQEAEFEALNPSQIQQQHKDFIVACGGVVNPKIKVSNKQLLKTKNKNLATPKGQSLQETKALVIQGMTIKQIAQKRQLAMATIVGHITQLIAQEGAESYLQIAPKQQVLEEIKAMRDTLKDIGEFDSGFLLRPIVEGLGNKYGYNMVRLALAFIDTPKNETDR